MELLHQIFPPWHIALDMFLLGLGTYAYLRIKQTTIILVSVYMFDSEKLSDRNLNILFQLELLKQYTGMP